MRRVTVLAASVAVVLSGVLASASSPAATQGRWVMREIGGPASLAYAINDRGQVVGQATATTGFPHAFLWQNRTARDLGTLGGDHSEAADINDRGQIVGWAETKMREDGEPIARGVVWRDGNPIDLGILAVQFMEVGPEAINNRGQIVGSTYTKSGSLRAFLWENGKLRNLGTLGGKTSAAADINERGAIVGWATTGAEDKYGDSIKHAVLWKSGKLVDLGTLGGPDSEAYAINNRGQIVGGSDTKSGDRHAFLWQKGAMRDLSPLREDTSEANAINERGQVVGWCGLKSGSFLWQNGRVIYLATPGRNDSRAYDINERGHIVGWAGDHAVLWTFKP